MVKMDNSAIIQPVMILVTGGTGFVGQALIQHLIASGKEVRILLRPSKISPQLPRSVPVDAAVSSLRDERGLRAALRGVDTVIHLAGSERRSSRANFNEVEVLGTQGLVNAAKQAGIQRILYLSHLGADRSSAYPFLRAKGVAENIIARSGLKFTILRSAVIFGPGDQFTTAFSRLLRISPGFVFIPEKGDTLLQPVWIEDAVNCLAMAIERDDLIAQTISIGGIEAISFRDILSNIMEATGLQKRFWNVSMPFLRGLALIMDQITRFPVSIHWLDYLAVDRTTALDSIPRTFGILPARFYRQLDYLSRAKKSLRRTKGLVF